MKKLALILSAFFITQCNMADNALTDNNNRQDQRVFEKQDSAYKRIAGTYAGQLTYNNGPSAQVEIRLYVDYRNNGIDADGKPRTIPVLLGFYYQDDRLTSDLPIEGKYDENSGKLTFTSGTDNKSNYSISLDGFLGANIYRAGATIRDSNIYSGNIDIHRVSQNVDSSGQQTRNADRIRKKFAEIEGTYTVKVIPDKKVGTPYVGSMILRVNENSTMPTLEGSFAITSNPKPVFAPANYLLHTNPHEVSFDLKGANSVYSVRGLMNCPDEGTDVKAVFCGTVTTYSYTAEFKAYPLQQ